MSTKIRLNFRLLLILLGLALVMQFVDPFKGWVTLIVALGGIWLASLYWVRKLQVGLRLQREMRFGWTQVGDSLEEHFTLVNEHWLPASWVEVLDGSNMPGYTVSRATGVDGSSTNSWRTKGMCTRRGLFTLGPTTLHTGDPFGIYTLTIQDPACTNIMVLPPIIPLPAIQVAPGGRTGEGHPRSDAPEKTVSASAVRQYAPGDSLRWIHWRTTARRDEPFVRIFDGTPSGDWWIFLDMDQAVQAGEGWDSTVENGVILAASLADRGLRMKRAVGLAANGQNLVWMPPQESSASRRYELMRQLALVEPGPHTLGQLMERTRPAIGKHTSLIIITPNTRPDWLKSLGMLLWRGAVPTVLLLDPVSFGGEGRPEAVMQSLADLGVARFLITRDLLDRPEARPGRQGSYEWRITPRGRAVAINKPSDTTWRSLG